jgi:VCBS repeat-containing protein
MFVKVLQVLLVVFAFAVLGSAADQSRPVCNAQTFGKMWPDSANHSKAQLSKLARCGELAICTRGVWRYRWESLTVRFDQLRGGSKLPKPAACEIPDESTKQNRTASTGTN